jgi:nicotinamide phosphoribosyltransferase
LIWKLVCALGDPLEVLPRLLNILYSKFKGYINEKGFKVLNEHIRLIQGDGVNMESIKNIVTLLEENGFSTDNLLFGSGGKFITLMLNENVFLFSEVVFYKNSIVIQ